MPAVDKMSANAIDNLLRSSKARAVGATKAGVKAKPAATPATAAREPKAKEEKAVRAEDGSKRPAKGGDGAKRTFLKCFSLRKADADAFRKLCAKRKRDHSYDSTVEAGARAVLADIIPPVLERIEAGENVVDGLSCKGEPVRTTCQIDRELYWRILDDLDVLRYENGAGGNASVSTIVRVAIRNSAGIN